MREAAAHGARAALDALAAAVPVPIARERVFRDAAAALGGKDVDAFLRAMGKSIGPPWQAGHKLAAAASLSAAQEPSG